MGCELCKNNPGPPGELPFGAVDFASGSSASAGSDSSASVEQRVQFLSKVQLFKRLPQDQHPILAASCSPVEFTKGSVLIKQGDEGAEFYIIVKGQVAVTIDSKKVASLTNGDYFGENALLRNEPRNASITAETSVSALKITRDKFQQLGLNEKLEFAKRAAVAGGDEGELIVKPPCKKTEEDRVVFSAALKSNANLSTMVTLDDSKCTAMIDIAWQEKVEAGEDIITQGSTDANYFYVVKSGTFEIMISKDGARSAESTENKDVEHVGTITEGASFGELALLYFAPRAATVKAKVESVVWVIDRRNFKKILNSQGDASAKEFVKHLEKNDLFSSLKDDEKLEVAQNLTEAQFSKGETIFEQGEKGSTFYILYEGEVAIIKDGKEVAKVKGTQERVSFFGELALLNSEKRSATIRVVSATIKTLCMDKMSFDMLLGPLEDIKKRGKNGGESKVGKGKAARQGSMVAKAVNDSEKPKILRKDLTRLGLLGCGGFGAVELVEHKKTKETYALKALSKGYILKCGMKRGVMSEKNIQYMCDSDFIVKLYETFNGSESLSFLLELALGGELYATYSKKGFHGSEKHAVFYIAGTVYAFDHLHDRKIVFRDLKPENLLLTDVGAVKLTDMGLAKVCVGKTYTTCGTPDYFAPEVIASVGHTKAVDWWALGILTFELMSGHPPFESAAPMQIYSKVTKGINKVAFPPKLKGACEELVKGLCKKEPTERLPMKKGGIENVKKASWYNGFQWTSFANGTLEAPYVPRVKSKKDIANFSASKEDMPPQIKYVDDGSGWDAEFATST